MLRTLSALASPTPENYDQTLERHLSGSIYLIRFQFKFAPWAACLARWFFRVVDYFPIECAVGIRKDHEASTYLLHDLNADQFSSCHVASLLNF